MRRILGSCSDGPGNRSPVWNASGGMVYRWRECVLLAELQFSSAADRPQDREPVPGGHILPVDLSDVFSVLRRLHLRSRRFWRASRTTVSARAGIAGLSLLGVPPSVQLHARGHV